MVSATTRWSERGSKKKKPATDCMYLIESGEAIEREWVRRVRRVEHALINVLLHIEFIYDKLSSSSSRSHPVARQQSCIWPNVEHLLLVNPSTKRATIKTTQSMLHRYGATLCVTTAFNCFQMNALPALRLFLFAYCVFDVLPSKCTFLCVSIGKCCISSPSFV